MDLENLSVKQWPKLGVHTKFGKHATTYLPAIPEFVEVVREWDREVRAVCGNSGHWFAHVSPETGLIVPKPGKPGDHRSSIACRDLRKWLKKSGLPYHSPHKFRHGHAVYALRMAKDVAALKAVSQNLMHENLAVTDGVYGVLSGTDVKRQIMQLGGGDPASHEGGKRELIAKLEGLLSELKQSGKPQ